MRNDERPAVLCSFGRECLEFSGLRWGYESACLKEKDQMYLGTAGFGTQTGLVAQIVDCGDSCWEYSMVAGLHEQTCPPDLPHEELA